MGKTPFGTRGVRYAYPLIGVCLSGDATDGISRFLSRWWRGRLCEVLNEHLFADEIFFPCFDVWQLPTDAHLSDSILRQSGYAGGGFVDGEHPDSCCAEF